MLKIRTEPEQHYDEANNVFINIAAVEFEIEHSLVSLSKWEAKYRIPFLGDKEKTGEQILDYIQMMVVSENFDPNWINLLSENDLNNINLYINSSETATTFPPTPDAPGKAETISSELIYYWMIGYNIPWEAQTWHLNRLFTLIKVCNLKQQKPKKRSQQEIAQQYREENARRLAESGSSG